MYDKAFALAVKIINVYRQLCDEKKEFVLSKQLLRSGTGIGANIREGIEAQSRKDFVAKLFIALKEAGEAEYWIDLLLETGYLDRNIGKTILDDLQEIQKLLNAIIKTTKKNTDRKDNL